MKFVQRRKSVIDSDFRLGATVQLLWHFEVLHWPSQSPDLNSIDYVVLVVYKSFPSNLTELETFVHVQRW